MADAQIALKRLWLPLGSTFIAIGVLVFRASHSWNTLRGDESLLLSDALEDGIGATLRSFGGYLHVVQRLMIWFASLFSPESFPKVIFTVAISFWIVNLVLLGIALQRLAQKTAIWIVLPLVALLPPLGIELMGDLAHIQIAMFIGISAIIVLAQFPTSTALLHVFGIYVLLFGLSSPSVALIAAWCFYRHEFPIVGTPEKEVPNRVILRYSIAGLFVQLWATTVQDDRFVEFSFNNFLEGLRFLLHSLLPQPYRDYYFDVDGGSDQQLNSLFLFFGLILVVAVLLRAGRAWQQPEPEARIAELVAFGIIATLFYTTISSEYHTGYIAALFVFLLVGIVWMIMDSQWILRYGAVLLLLIVVVSSFQSLIPDQNDDIFFGGSGWLFRDLGPWNEAIDKARAACLDLPGRNVLITTNAADTFWGVVISCRELK